MRINRIKLSGFKSFVDPTTLSLPGNLTGIVGPNGCGKSNIIDALLWVMGESSAKHLRGESMADVIFNGSNTRKPVGQAAVEIIFDNTDGTIGGQYAGFGEISIKRMLGRDGISSYFLNSTRCRRKDITQILLGTGIGSRGYSVIEQGMISRVIEARPEELRAFLEEAAGISKYKERRRETENRMQHTHENMERLNDICEELDKQLAHLQRQARAAERYQTLKAEERGLEARLIATRWRGLESGRETCHRVTEARITDVEAEVAKLRELESRQVTHREAQASAMERFNAIQSAFYACSADISRLEQSLKHSDEREGNIRRDLADAHATLEEVARAVAVERTQLAETAAALARGEPDYGEALEKQGRAAETLRIAEARLEQWQQDWEDFNRKHNLLAQREQTTRIQLEHLQTTVDEYRVRRADLAAEAELNATDAISRSIAEARQQEQELEGSRSQHAVARNAIRANLGQARGATQALAAALHEHQIQLEEQSGRLASLRALQESAYGEEQDIATSWLRDLGVESTNRLAELIEIDDGWENAIEAALRLPLGSLCGSDLPSRFFQDDRAAIAGTPVALIATRDNDTQAFPGDAVTLLANKLRGRVDLRPLLHEIHAADDEPAGRALLATLPAHAFVVLRDGTLLGTNWVRAPGRTDPGQSILARERRISALTAELEKHEGDTANLRQQLTNAQQRLRSMEDEEQTLSEHLETGTTRLGEARETLAGLEAEFQRRAARGSDIHNEQQRLSQLASEAETSMARMREDQQHADEALQGHLVQRQDLGELRSAIQEQLEQARTHWREQQQAVHAKELELQELRSRQQALDAAIARNTAAHTQLQQRSDEFARTLEEMLAPRELMQSQLKDALETKLRTETELAGARRELGGLDEAMRLADRERTEVEQLVSDAQARLEQARLDERAIEVRLQELRERLARTEADLAAVLSELSEADTPESVQEQLDKLELRINRLGPINLAAIDEYQQLAERKDYLDKQHADLSEALATLQEAIRKIDRETRTRFKETFDKVNNGLQAMFPVLFGGGHAYLELTGDDLLETGVTVMARPPGKRNSTIHLLSGGEKALTALAFVFSIFELNPAPFCLLDEVDAPLDDANVVRLTEMLITMSQRVQFLFVSHNKITMEIAGQLIGVTMQEPGVSRLVSVNMEEAVELAATA